MMQCRPKSSVAGHDLEERLNQVEWKPQIDMRKVGRTHKAASIKLTSMLWAQWCEHRDTMYNCLSRAEQRYLREADLIA